MRLVNICAFCLRTEKEVNRLIKIHKLYMCDDCGKDCKEILDSLNPNAVKELSAFKSKDETDSGYDGNDAA